jgi:DNA-binding SARP family transcriptional activator
VIRCGLANSREQKILAALLLDVNRIVPLTRLVDMIWDEKPPRSAAKAVRNCVSTLRRRLEAAGAPSGLITTEPAGCALPVRDDQVDLRTFASRVAQGRQLASTGQLEPAVERLRQALALWRGSALIGMVGKVIAAAAARLDDQRLSVQEECLAHELALGRGHQLVDELFALVESQPLRERPRGQLMLALYRSGRRSEALETYRQARQVLIHELGIEPGPQLTELHQAILIDDPHLNTAPGPRPDRQPVVPRQLPAAVAHFTGRIGELAMLTDLLQDRTDTGGIAIAAVSGTAGVGKPKPGS